MLTIVIIGFALLLFQQLYITQQLNVVNIQLENEAKEVTRILGRLEILERKYTGEVDTISLKNE